MQVYQNSSTKLAAKHFNMKLTGQFPIASEANAAILSEKLASSSSINIYLMRIYSLLDKFKPYLVEVFQNFSKSTIKKCCFFLYLRLQNNKMESPCIPT